MKKALVINYSQSGQLDQIMQNFSKGLADFELDVVKVVPEESYPFPWNTSNFYLPMPEVVLEEPIPLKPMTFKHEKYDLIVLGYQPWFLSPSLPTSSFLKDQQFIKLIKDTPVVTVIGARNMWINAQISVSKHLKDAGAKLVGNLALVDRAPNLLSAVSIVHWMMTGKKTKKWGIFPLPGISEADIENAESFGKVVNEQFAINPSSIQDTIVTNDGVRVNPNILFIEKRAKKIFFIWANIIKKKVANGGNRNFWTKFFRVYLNVALFGVSPILLTFYNLFSRPFLAKKIKREIESIQYLGIKD